MPRNRNRNQAKMSGAQPEMIAGRQVFAQTASTTVTIPVYPASFSRAAAIADVFQFYRCIKLRVIAIPQDTNIIFGYAPGAAFDTPPSTGAEIIQLPYAKYHGSGKFTDTKLDIPRKELVSDAQLSWFKTIVGTPATQFEIQGNLYVSTGATSSVVVIEYAFEFQSWNLAGNSPLSLVVKNTPKQKAVQEEPSETVMINGQTYVKSLA